jgi:hypothetical protein
VSVGCSVLLVVQQKDPRAIAGFLLLTLTGGFLVLRELDLVRGTFLRVATVIVPIVAVTGATLVVYGWRKSRDTGNRTKGVVLTSRSEDERATDAGAVKEE